MKVLQVSKFYPPVPGGIESVARELAEGLSALGWAADVLCADRTWSGRVDVDPCGARIVRAGSLGTWLSTSISAPLLWHLRRMAPAYDVIHVHMPNPLAALGVWFARPDALVVLHWHSDVVHQRRTLKLYEPLQRWLMERADQVIATSQAYAEGSGVLRRFRGKVTVVPLGIGDNAGFSDDRRVRAIRNEFAGRKLVFALGRLVDYKGFDVLIDAAGQLADDTVVLIGGSGPLAERLRAQVSMRGVGSRVKLLGRIDDDELMSYHRAADVFCLPSVNRAEAFGVAMLEAMSCGRPVVCTQVPGSAMPWVNQHGETGLVVPPGDALALGAALRRLVGDESLAHRLGAGARARFMREFQATTMVAGIDRLYRQLLGKSNEEIHDHNASQ